MHLQSIINGLWDNTWDISIDPGRDIEASTLLLDNSDVVYSQFPNNIFTLDRFPLQIVDNNKFGEVNIFYEKSLDNKSLYVYFNYCGQIIQFGLKRHSVITKSSQ
ncbi:hypothetical protein EEL32_06790 [Brevibacillus laterosporus]|nr:hypothetical protein EEL32_06790 [Brevibacillus laterosporus]